MGTGTAVTGGCTSIHYHIQAGQNGCIAFGTGAIVAAKVNDRRYLTMNKRQRRKAWLAKQVPQEPEYGAGVGLILGIRDNGVPRLPAMQAWARAVPKAYRRAGKCRKVEG